MSNVLDGTEPVDADLIEPFLTEMRNKVIPDIVRAIEGRAEARHRQMYGTEQTMHKAWRKRAEEAETSLANLISSSRTVRDVATLDGSSLTISDMAAWNTFCAAIGDLA